MANLLEEFYKRRALIRNLNYDEAQTRLSGFLDWLTTNEEIIAILEKLENNEQAEALLDRASWNTAPKASGLEEIIYIGLYFLRKVKEGKIIWGMARDKGIRPSYDSNRIQDVLDEVMERYINVAIDQIENELEEKFKNANPQRYYPPVILSGDFRGANLNINSTLTESSQMIQNISDGNEVVKNELVDLIDELKKILAEVPKDLAEDAKTVAWAAEELIKARTLETPNSTRIEITKEGLKKAAINLASVMPTVLVIAGKIIEAIDKIK